MGRAFVISLMILMLSSICMADRQQSPNVPKTGDQKYRESYGLGYEIGANLRRQETGVDIEVFFSAIREGLEGKEPQFSSQEIRNVLKLVRQKATVAEDRRYRERSAKNLEEGRVFLKANSMKPGVKTLPSGLQYIVIEEGNGPSPKATDWVKVNYRGTLIDGTEFDSSDRQGGPSVIRANSMIRGWTEALQLMKAGARWKIVVPSELAYRKQQFGSIPPNSTLIFEIEILAVGDDLIPSVSDLKSDSSEPTHVTSLDKDIQSPPDEEGE